MARRLTAAQRTARWPFVIAMRHMASMQNDRDNQVWTATPSMWATLSEAQAQLAHFDSDRSARAWHWAATAYGIIDRRSGELLAQVLLSR